MSNQKKSQTSDQKINRTTLIAGVIILSVIIYGLAFILPPEKFPRPTWHQYIQQTKEQIKADSNFVNCIARNNYLHKQDSCILNNSHAQIFSENGYMTLQEKFTYPLPHSPGARAQLKNDFTANSSPYATGGKVVFHPQYLEYTDSAFKYHYLHKQLKIMNALIVANFYRLHNNAQEINFNQLWPINPYFHPDQRGYYLKTSKYKLSQLCFHSLSPLMRDSNTCLSVYP